MLYGGETVHFQVYANDAAGLKTADFRQFDAEIAFFGAAAGNYAGIEWHSPTASALLPGLDMGPDSSPQPIVVLAKLRRQI